MFIAISQSGETADTLIAARSAKKAGAYVVAVVNARGSTLERLADTVLLVGAGTGNSRRFNESIHLATCNTVFTCS